MRKDKPQAFILRKEGKSYREIQSILGVSRSTLCEWFRDIEWSKHAKTNNTIKNISLSKKRLLKLNEGRVKKLKEKYDQVEQDAIENYKIYKNDSLFSAGLMIYAGEGDKTTRGDIRISNIDPAVHRIFINFAEKYLCIKRENMKAGTLAYPDLKIETCREYWAKQTGIPISNFHKTQVILGRHPSKRLQYGVFSTIILSTSLKLKLLKWINLYQSEYGNAGMV